MSLGKGPGGFVFDNTIRITRPYADVQKDLKEVAGAGPDEMDSKRNLGLGIFLNWAWKWEMVSQILVRIEVRLILTYL